MSSKLPSPTELFSRLFKRLTPRIVYSCSVVAYVFLVGSWLVPRFETPSASQERVQQNKGVLSAVAAAEDELNKLVRATPQPTTIKPEYKDVEVYVNPLIAIAARVGVNETPSSQQFEVVYQSTPFIRYDTLILLTGIWIVTTFALGVLVRSQKSTTKELAASPTRESTTAEEFLTNDVFQSKARALEWYSRSTLMLVAGIVMAFIGVAVFYVSLPQYVGADRTITYGASLMGLGINSSSQQPSPTSQKDELLAYLAHAIRPAFMLIFLEGIAWFLLREYRTLIEDYKSFHRMYLKRANYLIALKTVSCETVSPEKLLLVGSMLAEDLTGRLKTGETSENIEGVKLIEPNPVFTLVQSVMDGLKKK